MSNEIREPTFLVLASLADGMKHGYGIMQEVLKRTDGKVRLWPATLYGTLKRLGSQKLIEELLVGRASPPAPDLQVRLSAECESAWLTLFSLSRTGRRGPATGKLWPRTGRSTLLSAFFDEFLTHHTSASSEW